MSEKLTKEQLEMMEYNGEVPNYMAPDVIAMARQKIELEARVKELEDQREIARGIYPTLEKAEARIQELAAILVKRRRKAAINAGLLHEEVRENDEELKAQAAAMREALEYFSHWTLESGCAICGQKKYHASSCRVGKALSGEAGKALLKELEKLKTALKKIQDSPLDTVFIESANREVECDGCWERVEIAKAALGGEK